MLDSNWVAQDEYRNLMALHALLYLGFSRGQLHLLPPKPLLHAGEQIASGDYPRGFGTLDADWHSQRMKLCQSIMKLSQLILKHSK
jgi:hypothetical protein